MNGKEKLEALLAIHGQERVTPSLRHYSSEYYDPAKAREYYLRTRELKGQKAAEMNTAQREAFGYAKTQISEKKKAERTSFTEKTKADRVNARDAQVKKLEELRKSATESLARIDAKLKEFFASIESETKIPANASPKLRAFLEKNQATRKASAKRDSDKARREVGEAMRSAIGNARESYAAASKALSEQTKTGSQALEDKYKAASETEYQNIRKNV